jgi:endonuclease/exonuclease/phosphatase (EEP) superfamily protein YafD
MNSRRSSPSLAIRLLRVAVIGYTALVGALALLLWLGNDASPLGMLLGFAPRWWTVIPWMVLVPASLLLSWRIAIVSLAGILFTLFGVSTFELRGLLADGARRDLRLVTYNTDLSRSLALRLRADVAAWEADVVLLQDCRAVVFDSLRALLPHTVVAGRFCVGSRWPLLDAADATQLARVPDERIAPLRDAIRVRVRTPRGELPVYSVHFPSPRTALAAARWPQPDRLVPLLEASLAQRGAVSAAVSSIVDRRDAAFVVAGDFNLPIGSTILRRDWGDLVNAFAQAGTGFGHTMQAGVFPVRIDHVLVPRTLEPVAARVLSGYPSEHQPVLVDLRWAAP